MPVADDQNTEWTHRSHGMLFQNRSTRTTRTTTALPAGCIHHEDDKFDGGQPRMDHTSQGRTTATTNAVNALAHYPRFTIVTQEHHSQYHSHDEEDEEEDDEI